MTTIGMMVARRRSISLCDCVSISGGTSRVGRTLTETVRQGPSIDGAEMVGWKGAIACRNSRVYCPSW